MSIKILLFPFCIILSLVVIIGYIKPDVMNILETRKKIEKSQADLSRVASTIQNVQQMTMALNNHRESEKFVMKYLPISLEEERVLDTFNYLAVQSGVVISDVAIDENSPLETSLPEVLRASMSFEALANAQAASAVNAVTPPVAATQILHSYAGSITVLGAYSNLKDFFQRLSQSDRFRETKKFSIGKLDQEALKNEEGESTYPADFLQGTYEADFVHFPIRVIGSALELALFEKGQLDFQAADDLLNFVSNPLPPMEVNTAATSNPFQ